MEIISLLAIISYFGQSIFWIENAINFPITMLSVYLIGLILFGLAFLIVMLFIAGVYSCPSEDSFKPWLT